MDYLFVYSVYNICSFQSHTALLTARTDQFKKKLISLELFPQVNLNRTLDHREYKICHQ